MHGHHILIRWLLPALIATAGVVATPALAQTYKWKDAEGKIHYSDQPPPPNVKDLTVAPRKQAAPATPPAKGEAPTKAKTYAEQEAEFRKRQVEQAEREAAQKKLADEAAEKKRNCDQVRGQLKSLQAGVRITQTNANGEREYMSDAQISQEVERLKKAEGSWCK